MANSINQTYSRSLFTDFLMNGLEDRNNKHRV